MQEPRFDSFPHQQIEGQHHFPAIVLTVLLKKITKKYRYRLLDFEIKDINVNLNYLRANVRRIERELSECLPQDLVLRFFEFNEHMFSTLTKKTKSKLIKKFKNLTDNNNISLNPFNNIDKTQWLINISGKNIPERVSEFFSLGDNFGLPIHQSFKNDRVNIVLETLKNLEINYNRIPREAVESTRIVVANSLQKISLCE